MADEIKKAYLRGVLDAFWDIARQGSDASRDRDVKKTVELVFNACESDASDLTFKMPPESPWTPQPGDVEIVDQL